MTKAQKLDSKRTKPQTAGENVYLLAGGKHHTSMYTGWLRTPSLCPVQEERGQSPQSRSSIVRSRQEDGLQNTGTNAQILTCISGHLFGTLWNEALTVTQLLGTCILLLGLFLCLRVPVPPLCHPFSSLSFSFFSSSLLILFSLSPPSTPHSLLRHGRLVLWGHPPLCSSLSQDWVGCTGNSPICWLFAERIHCVLNKIRGRFKGAK